MQTAQYATGAWSGADELCAWSSGLSTSLGFSGRDWERPCSQHRRMVTGARILIANIRLRCWVFLMTFSFLF